MYQKPVNDERIALLDPEACDQIYHKFLEYVRTPGAISDSWTYVTIGPIVQDWFDRFSDEDVVIHKSDFAFCGQVLALRKFDGLNFCQSMCIPVEVKGQWNIINQFFELCCSGLEEYAKCGCVLLAPCSKHRSMEE